MSTQTPRRILLAVTGLTPQIVTETLYALACRTEAPWIPDEVHVITTATGAENARLNLLLPKKGWFHRLCRDYALPGISFPVQNIHILKDADGQPLDDIRTQQENTLAADFITETLRRLTEDPHTELHVSIAGGRKTMGYYLGYALSLYGRPQDRLSHVLVSDPYETNREFYYPTPYDHRIYSRRGDKEIAMDARNAKVELAEIPFVSLRHGLPEALLTGQASFRSTVEAARTAIAPATLALDPSTRKIQAGRIAFVLPPAQFALLAMFAHRARVSAAPLRAPLKDAKDVDWSNSYLADLTAACGKWNLPDSVEKALREGVDGNYFSQHLSSLRATLRRKLGPAAAPYLIDDGNVRPHLYHLALEPDTITFNHIGTPTPGQRDVTQNPTETL